MEGSVWLQQTAVEVLIIDTHTPTIVNTINIFGLGNNKFIPAQLGPRRGSTSLVSLIPY